MAAHVLALQRTAGNRAVSRSILGTAPEATSRPPLETPVVQRKVGFECEDAFWKVWRKYPFTDLRAVRRQEHLHSGSGFALEGDDSEGADKPSIEFVTKPYQASQAGMAELHQSFSEIEEIMAQLGQYHAAHRDGDLNNTARKRFIRGHQHGLNQTIWFSQGRPQARFKLQATHGMSLEDIPMFMHYMGKKVPNETPVEKNERLGARQILYPNAKPIQGNIAVAKLIGNAPSLADVAIVRLQNSPHLSATRRQSFAANTGALRGFLAEVILYVKCLTRAEAQAKYLIPILARTNFSTMFGLIPDAGHRRRLARNNAAALVDAIVHAANSAHFFTDAHGNAVDTGFAANGMLIHNVKPAGAAVPILQSLTLVDWVKGFTTGTDYLSPSTMEAWLVGNAGMGQAQAKTDSEALESMAVLGRGTNQPSTHTDPADIVGRTAMAIFENRIIAGKTYFTAPEAHEAAMNYLQFFIDLKTAGAPGVFPTAAGPAAAAAPGAGSSKYTDVTSVLAKFNL